MQYPVKIVSCCETFVQVASAEPYHGASANHGDIFGSIERFMYAVVVLEDPKRTGPP